MENWGIFLTLCRVHNKINMAKWRVFLMDDKQFFELSQQLPSELLSSDVLEKISEQIHNTWMEDRKKQGWIYGEERNDSLKQTPCIVPYSKLPEIEKEYDRNTVKATIKALYSLGFCISKGDT